MTEDAQSRTEKPGIPASGQEACAKVSEAPFVDAEPFSVELDEHRFWFYPAGVDRLKALVDLIEGAQRELHLFYYLFQADYSGHQVRDALVRAAKRGVEVHLIVDAFGSDAPLEFFKPLIDEGGRFDRFLPKWGTRYLIRNHQKFVIADGKTVLGGGFNVSDHYFKPPEENGWCDLGAKMEGPVVERFTGWFKLLRAWVSSPTPSFFAIRNAVRDWEEGEGNVRLLLGGPTRITSAWARRVKKDMASATQLDLVMAYFSPPRSIRRLIRRVAERGKARLITAGRSDNRTTIGASRALYRNLVDPGVKIFEFQPCKLHAKIVVLDDVVYFGSANFDLRSIRLNLELMVRVEDEGLANHFRELIDRMEEASVPIDDEWLKARRSIFTWIRWRLGWFVVSVVDYTVTRRLNLGA